VTPYGDSPQTAVFNIKGIETAIGPLAEACHWNTATASRRKRKPEPQLTPEEEFNELLRAVQEMDGKR
jgi:hypothetical protein